MSTTAKPLQRGATAATMEGGSPTPSPGLCRPMAEHKGVTNAMTIDVEDYFQVEAFASTIDREDWDRLPQRVERNTERILDILAEAGAQATFFVLGWIAQRHPGLVRRIIADGHELASHGSDHIRVDRLSPEAFRADVRHSKHVLEDCGGVLVRGYRAPTFSICCESSWAHQVLLEEGFFIAPACIRVNMISMGAPAHRAPRSLPSRGWLKCL